MSIATVHYLSMNTRHHGRVQEPSGRRVAGTSATYSFSRLANSDGYTINWGDGTASDTFTSDGSGNGSVAHTYPRAGKFTIQVTETSSGSQKSTDTIQVSGSVTPPGTITHGTSGSFVFALDANAQYHAFWGDSLSTDITADANGAATVAHTYANAGNYTITVKDIYNSNVLTQAVTAA